MTLFDVYPLYDIEIVEGKGELLWDKNGNEYLDLYGGHAVISIGHSHPHYVNKLKNQLDKIAFYSNSVIIPQQFELASLLGKITGLDDYQLFLCNSGAEANENALKLASFHNGRKKIVAFSKGFHGRTSLAVSATDNKNIIAPVNENNNVTILPFNDEEKLTLYFKKYGNEISAVIIEGIQGVGGIVEATPSFLRLIRELCDTYGTLFVADSVQCGYGRSGRFFSHDYAKIKADIYSVAKGMGNGFPIGAILIAPHIIPKHGMLGTTFGGNHLACTAAIGVLEVIEKENLMTNALILGDFLKSELKKIPNVKEIRGKGLMIGVEFTYPVEHLRNQLVKEFRIFVGNSSNKHVLRILPPLNVAKESLEKLVQALKILN